MSDAGQGRKNLADLRSPVLWVATAVVLGLMAVTVVLAVSWYRTGRAGAGNGYHYFGSRVSPPDELQDFTLTDQNGHPFHLSDLRGKLVLLEFGYTHCPNVCPMTLANLAALYRKLTPQEQQQVQEVFISVDPERDTPEVLAKYIPFFDPHFLGLTGRKEAVDKVVKEFHAYYEILPLNPKSPGSGYTISHSSYTYLLNKEGKLAVVYGFKQLSEADGIVRDIRHLLHDGDGSRSSASL